MKKLLLAIVVAVTVVQVAPRFENKAHATYYAEFYRDNLFLGLAYHRIACVTDWTTIQSNQDYDGFTTNRYCYSGTTSDYVPSGEWFTYIPFVSTASLSSVKYTMDLRGADANTCYATPNYQDRSNVCSYNITTDCNSDCWIQNFSLRLNGTRVDHMSGCWGAPPVSSVNGISCDM